MQTEKQIELKLNLLAKKLGVKSVKLAGANQKGQPDRIYLYNGKVVFMELKGEGKKKTATKLQLKWLKDLKSLGFVAELVDNYEDGERLLSQLIRI